MIVAPISAPPAPSSDLEKTLTDTLQRLDPLLGVMWVPFAAWNEPAKRMEGRYALTCRWPSIDGRWQEVQAGKVPESEANDIIGWLCEDMQDASSVPTSMDGITDRVLALLGSMDNLRYSWRDRMKATVQKNADRWKREKADAADQANRFAEHIYRQAKGVPQQPGADFDNKGKLIQ